MDVLGHDNIEHAELYRREAEQEVMAATAMEPLMNWRRTKPGWLTHLQRYDCSLFWRSLAESNRSLHRERVAS